jgi:hypothetical protein
LNEALIALANMGGASLRGAQLTRVRINAASLENADLTEADLTGSRWFAVNVSGADFSDAKITDAQATGVDWSKASVPPAEIPEPIPIPPWVAGLFAGVGLLFVVGIILAMKRRKA